MCAGSVLRQAGYFAVTPSAALPFDLHESPGATQEPTMTPEERNLVIELFDRLTTLEDAARDPDAERLIEDGLRQAPNAPYALVQTVLVQDEALRRADARIRELEEGNEL